MYDLGRRVHVKSWDAVGTITERNYVGKPRHATYVVGLEDGQDYMTSSADLEPADWQCDGCARWRPSSDRGEGSRDLEGLWLVRVCGLCVLEDRR